jgi:hypothetical protein
MLQLKADKFRYNDKLTAQTRSVIQELEEAGSVEETLQIAGQTLARLGTVGRSILNRLETLRAALDEEKASSPDEEVGDFALESLKGLILFVSGLEQLNKPQITVNDDGRLQLNWKKDRRESLVVSFKDLRTLHYLIFRPSRYSDERIILNGSMNIHDFEDYIETLDLQLHLQPN